jgi:hypothetical protein
VFRGKGVGLKIAPLPAITKADSGNVGAFSKLCEFSPAYLASVLASCGDGEEDQAPVEDEDEE